MTARIAGQARRDQTVDLRGNPEDITRITQTANAHGISPSRWAGDALADALEKATQWRDVTRRPAPRKPNRQPRQDRQSDRHQARLAIRVSTEEKTRIADLAGTLRMTVTEWAWGVIGEALEKEGQPS